MCFQQSSSTCIGRQGFYFGSKVARQLNWETRHAEEEVYTCTVQIGSCRQCIWKLQNCKEAKEISAILLVGERRVNILPHNRKLPFKKFPETLPQYKISKMESFAKKFGNADENTINQHLKLQEEFLIFLSFLKNYLENCFLRSCSQFTIISQWMLTHPQRLVFKKNLSPFNYRL